MKHTMFAYRDKDLEDSKGSDNKILYGSISTFSQKKKKKRKRNLIKRNTKEMLGLADRLANNLMQLKLVGYQMKWKMTVAK